MGRPQRGRGDHNADGEITVRMGRPHRGPRDHTADGETRALLICSTVRCSCRFDSPGFILALAEYSSKQQCSLQADQTIVLSEFHLMTDFFFLYRFVCTAHRRARGSFLAKTVGMRTGA